jgi:PAS domain S-box-containing protein
VPWRFPVDPTFADYHEVATAALDDARLSLRANALARAVPEAMPDAVVVVSEAGGIVAVNNQAELMFGYHRSELIGEPVEILIPESARERHVHHRDTFGEAPRIRDMGENLHLTARRKTGAEIAVLVRLGPVVIPDGVFTIVVIRRRPADG